MFDRNYYKYIVIKNDDVENYLTESQKEQLRKLLNIIGTSRSVDKKRRHYYVVVSDELPFHNQVWGMIEDYATNPDL